MADVGDCTPSRHPFNYSSSYQLIKSAPDILYQPTYPSYITLIMRLIKVFLSFPSILIFFCLPFAQAQSDTNLASTDSSNDQLEQSREAAELIELRGRLRDIESMLIAQKDRENDLLRDLNRMIMTSQEEPEEDPVEEARKELQAVENRFQQEAFALQAKIQQLEIALAAGQERDLQMGQEMNKTILVTVSTVAGVGLVVFLITVYLQYRLLNRPVQPVYLPPQALAIETGHDHLPVRGEPAKEEPETGLVENTKVKDTNEKFSSAVERLEERIRHMEAGLSQTEDVLDSESDNELAESSSASSHPEEIINVQEVIIEASAAPVESVNFEESKPEFDEDLDREMDEMDVAVLEEEGRRFLQKEDWRTAYQYFERLVKLDDQRVDNWVNRGRALEMLNLEEEAIESYDRAIEVNPDLPSPFLYKAALLSRLERFEEAQKFYNTALSKVPVQKNEEQAVAG